jgi:Fe-S cluster assembly iron-binding protein IscA
MINVTNRAVEKFNEILKSVDKPENKMLRVSFEGFG